jgi:ribosomal protein S18 acetylase RimI-like enzyme
MVEVRLARTTEFDTIVAIGKQSPFTRDVGLALHRGGQAAVALDADTIVGFAVYRPLVRKAGTTLYDIAVRPEARRRGVGALLIGYVWESGMRQPVRLVCDERNVDALSFYDRLGFERIGVRANRRGEKIVDMAWQP